MFFFIMACLFASFGYNVLSLSRYGWIPVAVMTAIALFCVAFMGIPRLFELKMSKYAYACFALSMYFAALLFIRDVLLALTDGFGKSYELPSLAAVALLTAVIGAVGVRNAVCVRTVRYNIPVKSPGIRRIGFFSVLHLGNVVGAAHTCRVAALLNDADCDVVIFGGDMFTGDPCAVRDRDDAAAALKTIHTRYGCFACRGNHDAESAVMTDFMRRAGIRLLVDAAVELEGLTFVFREDHRRQKFYGISQSISDIVGKDCRSPLIVVDHEPNRMEEAVESGAALVLSGHTHAVQLFPANILYRFMYKPSYGVYRKGDTYAVTSCGAGLWGPPMRTGSRSEIVIIELNNG